MNVMILVYMVEDIYYLRLHNIIFNRAIVFMYKNVHIIKI